MLTVDLFDGADSTLAQSEEYLGRRLKEIEQIVKANREVHLSITCLPQDREPCGNVLEEFAQSMNDGIRVVDKNIGHDNDGVSVRIAVDGIKLRNTTRIAEVFMEHVENRPELYEKRLDENEQKNVEEMLRWQFSIENGRPIDFLPRVRGAVGEEIMCRMFRSLQERYGAAAFELLERPQGKNVITQAPYLKEGKSLTFFSRHSCGFVLPTAKGWPQLEVDGILRIHNEHSIALDSSTSYEFAAGKNLQKKDVIFGKNFEGRLRHMSIIYQDRRKKIKEHFAGTKIMIPYRGSIMRLADQEEPSLRLALQDILQKNGEVSPIEYNI